MVIVIINYFYTTLHKLMQINFKINGLKCGFFIHYTSNDTIAIHPA